MQPERSRTPSWSSESPWRRASEVLFWALVALCVSPHLFAFIGSFIQQGSPATQPLNAAFRGSSRWAGLGWNTVQVTGLGMGLALCLGSPLGFLAFRTDLPGRSLVLVGCLMAACVPLHVTATSWLSLFGMGFWLYSPLGASWITGLAFVPLVALVVGVGLATTDPDLEESARLDASDLKVFWKVTLPLAGWALAAAGLLVVGLSLWEITITDILMVRTFGEEIFSQFQLTGSPGAALVSAFPAMLASMVLVWGISRLLRERGTSLLSVPRPPARFCLGQARLPFVGVVILMWIALLGIPLGSLFRSLKGLDNLATAWRVSSQELLGTLTLTPIAASLTTGIGIMASWRMARECRSQKWLWTWALVLLAMPAPLVGIGLIQLLNRPGIPGAIYDSQAGLVAAYVVRTAPFACLALVPAMKRIPKDLEDSLALDSDKGRHRLFHLILPLTWRAVAVAWLLSFVLAVSDLGASFLVVPPGRSTLTARFFTLIHYGVYPDAAGICLILLGIVALAASGMGLLLWPSMRQRWV